MDLRAQLLHQMLRKELDAARALESSGSPEKAAAHYATAAGLSRKLAPLEGESGKELASLASQYDAVGKAIPTAAAARDEDPATSGVIDQLIVSQKPSVRWEDIGGLAEVKEAIKEAAILPFVKKPAFVEAPRALLLYGPPGTGKTLLAKAAAANLQATFFEARLPALVSKYYGESTKLVSALFSKARERQPALVFIDELDALAQSRDGEMNEATRRILGQLLQELDGFAAAGRVMVIAATNKPWALDDALLSRFERKLFVPLPDAEARRAIISIQLRGAQASEALVSSAVARTEGFAGRDLANLCHEAVLHMVREQNPRLENLASADVERYSLATRPLQEADLAAALGKVKPGDASLGRYEEWGREFGA